MSGARAIQLSLLQLHQVNKNVGYNDNGEYVNPPPLYMYIFSRVGRARVFTRPCCLVFTCFKKLGDNNNGKNINLLLAGPGCKEVKCIAPG